MDDQIGSPTYSWDLAGAVRLLIEGGQEGVFHLTNRGRCSWHEFAVAIVDLAREQGLPVRARRIVPLRTEEYPLPAARPAYSVFSKEKYLAATGASVPQWQESLQFYLHERSQ